MCQFCHLHVHTDGSMLDGLGRVDDLVKTAHNKGFTQLGITDHGTLLNTVAFISSCKEYNIKPIVGLEGYLNEAGEIFHLTLLSDGNKGFRNLVQLSNDAKRSETKRPSFTMQQLKQYSDGLIVLSGCPASPMQSLEWADARQIGLQLKSVFKERFFAELMFVQKDNPSWERSIQISKDLKIPLITTNDVHFHEKHHAQNHTVLKDLKSGGYLDYDSSELWLTTPDEMNERLANWGLSTYSKELNEGMINAYNLASGISVVKLDPTPSLPEIEDADKQLSRLAYWGLDEKIARPGNDVGWPLGRPIVGYSKEYDERIEYELDTIKTMGFSSYFLILKDVIDYARSNGVRVGPGRGSGCGSLVLYLLDCTEVDPIEHGLSFERFLNPNRKEMPDVDTDFDSQGRQLVIDYASKKWNALPIATYGRYEEKSLIRELLKYFEISKEIENEAAEYGVGGKAWHNETKNNPLIASSFDIMHGQIKQIGKHAGGVVIARKDDVLPLERAADGSLLVGWTEGQNKELTATGLVKFDFLGVTALDIVKRLEAKHGKAPMPTDNDPVFNLFKSGDTAGIFQFDTAIMHNLSLKMQPNNFNDLVAQVALKLPGPLNAGTTEHYIEYKQKPRKLHPIIDGVLEETYGIICYQEQFMQIYANVTDGNLADADFARKVIVKANPGNPEWERKFSELKTKFEAGCKKHGMKQILIDQIWSEITTHSRYSFNKSHAVAYTMISWAMAWFKYHHACDFYAALLSTKPDEAMEYIFHAVRKGIKIVPPDINQSTNEWISDGNTIYMPLSSVKSLGDVAANAIINARPFKNLEDFINRIPKKQCNKRIKKGLFALGAFDSILDKSSNLNPIDILGIDAILETSIEAIQNAYLGYIIPTQELFSKIDKAALTNLRGGIVIDKIEKNNGYKPFVSFKLLPYGSVWSNDPRIMNAISIGDKLSFEVTDGKDNRPPNKILKYYPL